MIPVIKKLSSLVSVPISIDTYNPEVAQKALEAGATIINDIWGLKHDEKIAQIVSAFKGKLIIMHNQQCLLVLIQQNLVKILH